MNTNRLSLLLACLVSVPTLAADAETAKPLKAQIAEAEQCLTLAYGVELKHFDADKVFQDCVERRAILLGMQKRYGVGQFGEVDVIDKLEGYHLLSQSRNQKIQQEASRFATASGGF